MTNVQQQIDKLITTFTKLDNESKSQPNFNQIQQMKHIFGQIILIEHVYSEQVEKKYFPNMSDSKASTALIKLADIRLFSRKIEDAINKYESNMKPAIKSVLIDTNLSTTSERPKSLKQKSLRQKLKAFINDDGDISVGGLSTEYNMTGGEDDTKSINQAKAVLVLYSSKNCPACRSFFSAWDELERKLHDNKDIYAVKVDAVDYKIGTDDDTSKKIDEAIAQLHKTNKILTIPTIILYTNNKAYTYDGNRQPDDIIKFVKSHTK